MEWRHVYGNVAIEACISSKVRPLVSGTSFATNRSVKPQIDEKNRNVPEAVQSVDKNYYQFLIFYNEHELIGRTELRYVPAELHSIM